MTRSLALAVIAAAAATVAAAEAPKSDAATALDLIVAKNYGAARALIEPLAKSGDRDARHMLGFLEQKGLGGPKNIERAIALYYEAATAGSADAQYALGEIAFSGDGAKKDYGRAAGWYQLAAGQSHAGAETRLGQMHAEGTGVPKDPKLAATLFRKAAEKNDPSAEYYLGNAYLAGAGVAQSHRKAAELYGRAAEQGHADAQYNLALLYDSDRLGRPDGKKAYGWMRAAADYSGLPDAMVALGLMAHNGRAPGEKPADWFEKAAKAGDAQGQFLYAVAFFQGDGRPKDAGAALMWLDRAVAAGDLPDAMRANAKELRASLVKQGGEIRD